MILAFSVSITSAKKSESVFGEWNQIMGVILLSVIDGDLTNVSSFIWYQTFTKNGASKLPTLRTTGLKGQRYGCYEARSPNSPSLCLDQTASSIESTQWAHPFLWVIQIMRYTPGEVLNQPQVTSI